MHGNARSVFLSLSYNILKNKLFLTITLPNICVKKLNITHYIYDYDQKIMKIMTIR